MVVGAPSISTDVAPTFRISLVRVGELPDAAWLAEVEDHPQFSARGATPEEAARRAWAAIEESRLAVGEVADEAPPAPRHSGKLLVRMPATLHDELARTAESEGVSLNQLITGILASSVEWRSNDGSSRASGAARMADPAARSHRLTRTVLAANFALVLLAGIVAVALLLTAWLD
jgi:predicted HicB family RNase H-like nuclease